MKKHIKFLLAAALAATLMAALAGCGKKGDDTETEKKEFVYVAEYAQIDMEYDNINQAAGEGDTLFFSAVNWDDEAGQRTNYLCKYDLVNNEAEQLSLEMDENSNVSGMAVGSDGNLLMIINRYVYETDENDEIVDGKSVIELWKVSSEDGSVLNTKDITEFLGQSEYVYVQYFCADGQDNVYFSDGDNVIHVLNKDFQKVCDITTENWINTMVASKEGDVYIATYGSNGLELKKIDLAAKSLGTAVEGLSKGYGNNNYYTGQSKSFLISGSDQVSLYDLSTGTSEDLFKWLDVDINSSDIDYAGEVSDGRIWAVTSEYDGTGSNYELAYISRKNASEVQEKTEITYGALWLDSDVRKSIIDFNKKSGTYRITVKEYAGDDVQTGLSQFNADLTTGNCPDIIDLSNINYSQYASKGVLEDLYPYMEKSGIDKTDYLENVLKAYEADGKLYGIMPRFYISTTIAKASLVGEKRGWTLPEMLDFVESNSPENVFSYGDRDSIFRYCIYNNIDEFIDWDTGKCSFDGEGFIRTLEFAAKFPDEDEVNYNYEEQEGIASQIHSNKVLLMQAVISSVQEYQMMNGLFGEKVSYVGYPNSEKKGNLIYPTRGSMGLSAKSKNKDGAWEFMRTMISEEYQDGLVSEHGGWGFPVTKSALNKQFEIDMTPEYYEDENGEQVEQPKTTWGYDDFEMEIYAATEEEIEEVMNLISSAEKLPGNVDEQLVNIITEESAPFFKGQKTAADTAAIIQNRIQIYVNENS